jgi:excinuclease ABC subunit C
LLPPGDFALAHSTEGILVALFPANIQPFDAFGASAVHRSKHGAAGMELAESRRDNRRQLREACPTFPGVYGMVDRFGQLIYVGKAKRLRHRLLSYFHAGADDVKAGEIITHTVRLIWEPAPHEFAALARELELIRRWLPAYNVQGRTDRFSRWYLCIGRAPAAYVYLASEPTRRSTECFGPMRSRQQLSEAVRFLNHQFRLRDCPDRVPMVFTDQLRLWDDPGRAACDRMDMGTCLGPCAGGCTRDEYLNHLRRVKAFLNGRDVRLLARLERDMATAASATEYERAAMLRDIWTSLDWLHRSLDRLRTARDRLSFVYPVIRADGREYWFALRRGQIKHAALAPHNHATARRWRAKLRTIYARRGRAPPEPEDVEMLYLIAAWFRRFPHELAMAIPPKRAQDRCNDVITSFG